MTVLVCTRTSRSTPRPVCWATHYILEMPMNTSMRWDYFLLLTHIKISSFAWQCWSSLEVGWQKQETLTSSSMMRSPQSQRRTLVKKSLSSHQKPESPIRFWSKVATVSFLGEPGCLSLKIGQFLPSCSPALAQPAVQPCSPSLSALPSWPHGLPALALSPHKTRHCTWTHLLSINGNLLLSAFANHCHGPDAPFIPRLVLFVNRAGAKWKPTHSPPALPFSWRFLLYEPRK